MTFTLKTLRPARKTLDKLDRDTSEKIYAHLEELKLDPYTARSGMDIRKIEGNRCPPAYRLRIGRWRAEYLIDGQQVVVLRVFPRRRDSDYK